LEHVAMMSPSRRLHFIFDLYIHIIGFITKFVMM